MLNLYWDIGAAIAAMQEKQGWGAGVIPRLARDLAYAPPEVNRFSERNIGYMIQFAREYGPRPILQQAVAKLNPLEIPSASRAARPITKGQAKVAGRNLMECGGRAIAATPLFGRCGRIAPSQSDAATGTLPPHSEGSVRHSRSPTADHPGFSS